MTATATLTDAEIKKLQSLYNLAKRPGTPAEGDSAYMKLYTLSQKYGIDLTSWIKSGKDLKVWLVSIKLATEKIEHVEETTDYYETEETEETTDYYETEETEETDETEEEPTEEENEFYQRFCDFSRKNCNDKQSMAEKYAQFSAYEDQLKKEKEEVYQKYLRREAADHVTTKWAAYKAEEAAKEAAKEKESWHLATDPLGWFFIVLTYVFVGIGFCYSNQNMDSAMTFLVWCPVAASTLLSIGHFSSRFECGFSKAVAIFLYRSVVLFACVLILAMICNAVSGKTTKRKR